MLKSTLRLILFLIICLPVSQITPEVYKQRSADIEWIMIVYEDGSSSISITLQNIEENQYFWMLLPSDEVVINATPKEGLFFYEKEPQNYFYSNYSFKVINATKLTIHYQLAYASLIGGDKAFMLSPLIVFDPRFSGKLRIVVMNVQRIFECSPQPSREESINDSRILEFGIPLESERVWVAYELKHGFGEEEFFINGAKVTVTRLYLPLLKPMLSKMNMYKRELEQLFGFSIENVTIRFYTPYSLDEPLGYTFLENRTTLSDEIYVNLLTLRYPPGYMTFIILHELTHLYLWRAGVGANLRWFHEGAATFIPFYVLRDESSYGIEVYRDILESTSLKLSNVTFILNWQDEEPYYAAAYKIFNELNSTLGPRYFTRLFRAIHLNGSMINSNQELFQVMRSTSNGTSDEVLIKLGINPVVGEESKETTSAPIMMITIVIVALLIIYMVVRELEAIRARTEKTN